MYTVLGWIKLGILVGFVARPADWLLFSLRLSHYLQVHLHFALTASSTIEKTALDQGRTDRISLTHNLDLD